MAKTLLDKKLHERLPSFLADMNIGGKVAVVCDEATLAAQGEALRPMLEAMDAHWIHLGKKPKASLEVAERIIAEARGCAWICSIGSGTITDVSKYAAAKLILPLVACATAPSMNGYLSSTASLANGKLKYSLPACQPVAVVADVDVLSNAPRRLIRAGLGDVMCRSTVQADWLLSHHLLGTPYQAELYERWMPLEAELVAQSIRLTEKDPTFIKLLMRVLLVSGEAMHLAGSSAPASQGEHMIAHLFEMLYGTEQAIESFHGEQIAVTTLTMARIQDKLLIKKPKIKANTESADKFQRLFGKEYGPSMWESYQRKSLSAQDATELSAKLDVTWPDIKAQLEQVRLKSALLENALKKANCPVSHRDVSWHKDRYEHAVTHAYLSRDRFTFLDLMAMDATVRVGI